MDLDEVERVLDGLDAAGVRCWVLGGWGVDALAGRQTRDHRDLDLAVDREQWDAGAEDLEHRRHRGVDVDAQRGRHPRS